MAQLCRGTIVPSPEDAEGAEKILSRFHARPPLNNSEVSGVSNTELLCLFLRASSQSALRFRSAGWGQCKPNREDHTASFTSSILSVPGGRERKPCLADDHSCRFAGKWRPIRLLSNGEQRSCVSHLQC